MIFRAISVVLAVAVGSSIASAQFGYAIKSQPIKAGVLLIESQRVGNGNGVPMNPRPHVWFALDQDRSARPAAWTLMNPRSQSVVTQSIFDRWQQIPGAGPIPAVGTRLDKRSAPYWEVFLASMTDQQMADYDVLLLSVEGTLSLNSAEREKLRRFVDQGGVLWVDVVSNGNINGRIDVINALPIPFELQTGAGNLFSNPLHPALTYPNAVTYEELSLMQFGGNELVSPVTQGSIGGLINVQAWLIPDSFRLDPVAGYGDYATIASAQLGQGYVFITTRGVSATLNRGVSPSGAVVANTGFTSFNPATDVMSTAAAKLIVNAISLTSGYTTTSKGSRRTNSSPIDITAPLLNRFDAPLPGGGLTSGRPPTVFKGAVVVCTDTRVIVMDADPSVDFDADGNPDDGMMDTPDYPGDVIWQSQALPGPISAPTCVEVPEVGESGALTNPTRGGTLVTDQILVVDGQGRLHLFDLQYSPTNPNLNNIAPIASVNPPDGSSPGEGPFAPTAHEGLAFVADARNADQLGRVWIADLRTGTAVVSNNPWGISQSSRMQPPSGPCTVGYIPILDNSGGVDRVVYLPSINNPGIGRGAGIASLWLGARGEKPVSVSVSAGVLRVTTRASYNGLPIALPGAASPLGVKITVLQANGDPYSSTQVGSFFTGSVTPGGGNGELNLGLTNAGQTLDWSGTTPNPNDDASLRIDYTIDWGAVGIGNGQAPPDAFVRGNLILPDDVDMSRRILGSLALTNKGHLIAVSGAPIDQNGLPTVADKGGSVYNFREEGRGSFKLVYRWDLYRDHTISLNSGQSQADLVPYREALVDEEGFIRAIPPGFIRNLLSAPMQNMVFQGGATVKGETVYVSVGATKSTFVRVCAVLALRAHPSPVEFYVDNISGSYNVSQRDVVRSSNKAQPEFFSELRGGQYSAERVPNSTLTRIRLDSMMAVQQGQIRDCLSTSLPIVIRARGQANTDILIEPELSNIQDPFGPGYASGKFSPLLWYTVFNGLGRASQPLVTGQTLYVGGASVLPALFQQPFQGFFESGMIQGMDSEISLNDTYVASNSVRPWELQVNQALPDANPPGFKINPAFRWPQANGVQSFDDYRVRLLQTAIPDPRAFGVVGGDGTVLTWSGGTLYAFSRYDFYIADENRVGRFDASGNPIWTSDFSLSAGGSGPVVGAGNVKPISRPTRVYAGGSNSYWVVDTGGDRIVRFDAAGRELRTVDRMKLDPKFMPAGAPDNLKRELRAPKDVLVFTTYQPNPVGMSNPRPLELWVHYLIADGGNNRMLELVDRYEVNPTTRRIIGAVQYVDPQSSRPGQLERALGVLLWHSPPELSGKQYGYNSISRVFVDDGNGGRRPIYAFGFGNFEPGKTTFGLDTTNQDQDSSSGFGGIVLLDGAQTRLITKVRVPAIPANTFWVDANNSWSSPAQAALERKIAGLSSVTMKYVLVNGAPQLAVMYTDNSGVYEVSSQNGIDWDVRWMMPNDAFRVMRRNSADVPTGVNAKNARPVYARRIDNGDVIIVNGYVGTTRNNAQYFGEITMVEGIFDPVGNDRGFGWTKRNLGFNSMAVKAELPPIQGTRGLVAPVFGDRR